MKGLNYHMMDLDFTQQAVIAALRWRKTSNMEEGLETRETLKVERQLAEMAIVQVRDDEGLNPNSAAEIKRKEWQSHTSCA